MTAEVDSMQIWNVDDDVMISKPKKWSNIKTVKQHLKNLEYVVKFHL